MLPRMREKLGTGVFAVDDVLELLLQEQPGERRKAYLPRGRWSAASRRT
jgi:hypothetical protein